MNTESIIKPPESQKLKSGRVVLSSGEEIGEHITDKSEELIIVLKGTVTLIKKGEEIQLKTGETYYIEPETKHNVVNHSDDEVEYIYVVSLLD